MTSPSKPDSLQSVGVIGSGTMGAGIVQAAALNGYAVVLYDLSDELLTRSVQKIQQGLNRDLEKGRLTQIDVDQLNAGLTTSTLLSELAQCNLVIEAAPESLPLKQALFKQLDELAPPQTILASNTSSISITALGGVTQRPGQVAGLHFFNPVSHMKLVEVIAGQRTTPETLNTLKQFAESLGKTAVLAKDTPGFIVNRVARPFYGEALRLLGEQAGSVEMIDQVMKAAGGFRMGPFELMDLIGIDVNFAVTQSVYDAYFGEPRYRPHPIQQRMVAAGLLGRKTGQGFYSYE